MCLSLNAYHKHPALGEMPSYVRNIVLEKLGNFWRLGENRKRIKRRLSALQNLVLMKNNIRNELENIKNGLSYSESALEFDKEKILVNNCNGDCSTTCKGKNTNFTFIFIVFCNVIHPSHNYFIRPGSLGLINRQPITSSHLLNESEASRPKVLNGPIALQTKFLKILK